MPSENSRIRKEAEIALLGHLDRGELDGLPCPKCGQSSISVWFTNPGPQHFRIWLMCERCSYENKIVCDAKPHGFSASRVHQAKQLEDIKTLGRMFFPNPNG